MAGVLVQVFRRIGVTTKRGDIVWQTQAAFRFTIPTLI